MQIRLNLVKSLIIEAVKAETYIKGEIDKASAQGTNKFAYNEQAGDDEYHERKLIRTMNTALGELKGLLSNYLNNSGDNIADNITSGTDANDNDVIFIELNVSDRFNKAYSDPLAKLCSKYIEDKMLVLWWGAINQNQAAFYNTLVASDVDSIEKCFNKTAPAAPKTGYTTSIQGEGQTIDVAVGESYDYEYTIDDGCVDDIAFETINSFVEVYWVKPGRLRIKRISEGDDVTMVSLYSTHNNSVAYTFIVDMP